MSTPAPVAKNRLHNLMVKRVDLVDRGAVRDPDSPAEPQTFLVYKSEAAPETVRKDKAPPASAGTHPFMPGGAGGACKICGQARDGDAHAGAAKAEAARQGMERWSGRLGGLDLRQWAAALDAVLGAAGVAKAEWSGADQNDLPDSAFAVVEPGGEKDGGKTTPRSKRHLPYKGPDGKVDLPHLRNALSRLPQSDLSDDLKAEARKVLEAAATRAGVGDDGGDPTASKQEENPMHEKLTALLDKAADQEAAIEPLVNKAAPEAERDAVMGAVRLLGKAGSALTPEVKAGIAASFALVEKAEDKSPEDVLKAELDKLPAALRQHIAAIEKKAQDADGVAKAERDARRRGEIAAVAKADLTHVPQLGEAQVVDLLFKLEQQDPETAKAVTDVLKSASKAIKEGDLLKELGSSWQSDVAKGGSPEAQLQAKADELKKADPKLTPAAALAQAATDNPDLYAAHKAAQDETRRGRQH